MKLSDDFLEKWEHIISDIEDKTAVPIECIEKVIIKFSNRRRKTINFKTLQRQGLDHDDIETLLNKVLDEFGDEVHDLEFILDVHAVATMIQPETDRILKGI